MIESCLLPDSRYEHDWLSHRFFHNLKSHSNGLDYKTRPFAEVHGSLMSRLDEITDFTIFRRFVKKNRGRNDFSHFTIFRYFFVFLTNQVGLLKSTK